MTCSQKCQRTSQPCNSETFLAGTSLIPHWKDFGGKRREILRRQCVSQRCWIAEVWSLYLFRDLGYDVYRFFASKDRSMGKISKKINKMSSDLNDIAASFDRLEELSRSKDYENVPEYGGQVSDVFRKSEAQMSKDITGMWSKIRGYKYEIDVALKQIEKLRRIAFDKNELKKADVASVGGGKSRAFQLKTHSANSNKGAAEHVETAFFQLFGGNGEIPGKGAKLIARLKIHSGKCVWPLAEGAYKDPSKLPSPNDLISASKRTCLISAKIGYNLALKKFRDEQKKDGPKGASRARVFFDNIGTVEVKLVIEYVKQYQVGPGKDYIPRLQSNGKGVELTKLTQVYRVSTRNNRIYCDGVYLEKKVSPVAVESSRDRDANRLAQREAKSRIAKREGAAAKKRTRVADRIDPKVKRPSKKARRI